MKKLLMLIAMSLMVTGIGATAAPTETQAQSYRSDRGYDRARGPSVRRAQVRRAQRARARSYRNDRRFDSRRGYSHRDYRGPRDHRGFNDRRGRR